MSFSQICELDALLGDVSQTSPFPLQTAAAGGTAVVEAEIGRRTSCLAAVGTIRFYIFVEFSPIPGKIIEREKNCMIVQEDDFGGADDEANERREEGWREACKQDRNKAIYVSIFPRCSSL